MKTKARPVWASAAAAASIITLSLGSVVPAVAAEPRSENSILNELVSAAPELHAAVVRNGDTTASRDNVTAEISEDTISISSPAGSFLTTAPEDTSSSSVHSVLLEEASALFAIRIDDGTAPRAYDFDVDLPTGATATLADTGAVVYRSEGGEYLGGVAVPWARDAAGQDLPTWFTFSDGTLTQHVDLDAVQNVTYPVIADPLNGQWLISAAWITYQSDRSQYVVNATPTEYGRRMGQTDLPQHTADLKSRLGSNAYLVIPTIENQFHCHTAFNGYGGGQTYNMESWRPNVPYWIQAAKGCNP